MARNMETAGSTPSRQQPEVDDSVANLEAMFGDDTDSSEVKQQFEDAGMTTPEASGKLRPDQEAISASSPESTMGNFYSRMADRVTNSAAKITAVLETLSAGAPARQEARAESVEAGKQALNKAGRSALKGAKAAGLFTLGMSVLTVETVVDGGIKARTKVTEIAMKARVRYAERVAYKEKTRRDQEDAFASYAPNIETTQNREENERMDDEFKAQELEMLEEAHDDNEAFNAERDRKAEVARQEAEVRAEFEQYKAELQAKRLAAYERKMARKEQRAEVIGNLKEKGSEIYAKAKRGGKRFGLAALKMLKRTASTAKAAVKGAVNAGAQAWSEAATPSPSN